MLWLGRWQWGAAHKHHGELRNYGYALQWWAFTGFAVVMWWRVVRDFLRPAELADDGSSTATGDSSGVDRVAGAAGAEQPPSYVGYTPPPPPADDDPERARFNAYLARLNASPQPEERPVDREESR